MDDMSWDRDFALEQAGADEDLLRELLIVFAGTVTANRQEIEKALAEDNWPQVARMAHSIKGSASSLGFGQIADRADTLERQARQGDSGDDTRKFLTILMALEEKLPTLA